MNSLVLSQTILSKRRLFLSMPCQGLGHLNPAASHNSSSALFSLSPLLINLVSLHLSSEHIRGYNAFRQYFSFGLPIPGKPRWLVIETEKNFASAQTFGLNLQKKILCNVCQGNTILRNNDMAGNCVRVRLLWGPSSGMSQMLYYKGKCNVDRHD